MKTEYDPHDVLACRNHEIEELREQNYALIKTILVLGAALVVVCIMYIH